MSYFIIDPASDELYHWAITTNKERWSNISASTWIESSAISECKTQKSDNKYFKMW